MMLAVYAIVVFGGRSRWVYDWYRYEQCGIEFLSRGNTKWCDTKLCIGADKKGMSVEMRCILI